MRSAAFISLQPTLWLGRTYQATLVEPLWQLRHYRVQA